ncbi:MAG: hypothetical protein K2R98_00415 [Gemmataceae bacterium]|nr:hypothetical protein [Gemmataceae bacterium]
MQKLFWFGSLTAITAAAVVYMAADYAEQYPDSMPGRCFYAAYSMVEDCNPIFGVCPKVCVRACHAVSDAVASKSETQHASRSCPVPQKHDIPSRAPVEIIDLSMVESKWESVGDLNAHEGEESAPEYYRGMPVTVPPGDFEESEDVPASMPPADEPEEIPAPSECVDDVPTMEDLIQESTETECKEGCSWWNAFFGGSDECEKVVTPEEVPMPTEAPVEESQDQAGMPPDCHENPHHHHEYQGCPYMGGCPRSCPVVPATPAEETPKVKKKKVKVVPKSAMEQPIKPVHYEEAQEIQPSLVNPEEYDRTKGESLPMEPSIDTMEFRSSDAHKGEFDPKPY